MTQNNTHSFKLVLLLAVLAYALVSSLLTSTNVYSYSFGPNYRNVTVDTRVNITQSLPTVLTVMIDDGSQVTKNITLNAGTYKNITCNATIQDYNGGSTIDNITATFFYNATVGGVLSTAPDDNNTHYSNSNCTLLTSSGFLRNASCSFLVYYYANNGQWACNVTATDSYGFNASVNRSRSLANGTNLDAVYALNVTPLIDYGNLAVGDTSATQQANVSNIGNKAINLSVKGYGVVLNDGLALNCSIGNITIQNEKFNIIGGTDPTTFTNMSGGYQNVTGLTIVKQTNATTMNYSTNITYWQLYVPPNPFGLCTGNVVFQAELAN